MRIGVPKEIKDHEDRVGLVPSSVAELVAHGHEVLVEKGAGRGAGIADRDFVKAGARSPWRSSARSSGPTISSSPISTSRPTPIRPAISSPPAPPASPMRR